MINSDKAAVEALRLLGEMRQYRGSEPYNAVIRLLDAMEIYYGMALIDATKERVELIQGAGQQCRFLKDAMLSDKDGRVSLPVVV